MGGWCHVIFIAYLWLKLNRNHIVAYFMISASASSSKQIDIILNSDKAGGSRRTHAVTDRRQSAGREFLWRTWSKKQNSRSFTADRRIMAALFIYRHRSIKTDIYALCNKHITKNRSLFKCLAFGLSASCNMFGEICRSKQHKRF